MVLILSPDLRRWTEVVWRTVTALAVKLLAAMEYSESGRQDQEARGSDVPHSESMNGWPRDVDCESFSNCRSLPTGVRGRIARRQP